MKKDSPLQGYIIGAIICTCITVMSMCSSSCSRKVTEHLEDTDSMTVISGSSSTSASFNYQSSTLNLQSSIFTKDYSSWNTHALITYYSTPDSLGNQFVTHTAEIQSEATAEHHDSTLNRQSSILNHQSSTLNHQSDTLYITRTRTITKDKVVTSPIPWYYRYSLYATGILILLALLYLLYRNRKRILHTYNWFFI